MKVKRLQQKRTRREERLLVAEGEDVVQAALDHGIVPSLLIFDEERVAEDDPRVLATSSVRERYMVSTRLMGGISTMAQPPRILGVFPQPGPYHFRSVAMPPTIGVYLAGVADPGNVGTLVRTSAALGADWLALGPGSADVAHPRAVRAAMGATFTLPLLEGVRPEDLVTVEGFRIVAAVAHGGEAPWDVDLTVPTVLALGAERAGLDPVMDALRASVEVVEVTIPQADGAESLNVSAAGAVLLAERLRQSIRMPRS
ncbi:MAG: RNA methyltransferase [Thermoleophilia bacterium]|nr:RNA methyltransferase [Thermoleophilia bacterium]